MRKISTVAVAALAMVCAPFAVDAASYENASRLVVATNLQGEIDRAIGEAVAGVRTQLAQQGMTPDKIDAFAAIFRDELESSSPGLIREMTATYADRFSDAEIEDLVAFYETPTGRKLVSVQHELAAAQARAVTGWITTAVQRAAEKLNSLGASV